MYFNVVFVFLLTFGKATGVKKKVHDNPNPFIGKGLTKERSTTKTAYRASSCKELNEYHPHLKSGTYSLIVGKKEFEAWCGMEMDNGGWLMVGSAVVKRNEEANEVDWKAIRSDDYSQLGRVTGGRFLLSTKGLNSLFDSVPFTEIRFSCYKKYHNRRLHLKTVGNDVIQWLLQRKSNYIHSCGTYSQLEGDDSYLGGDCTRWWSRIWHNKVIYHLPIYAHDYRSRLTYSVSLNYDIYKHLLCDDWFDHPKFNDAGEWSWYVR